MGNRISKFYTNEIDSIEKIKPINLKEGRISEVLTSIKMLKQNGEDIIINITGPISIATGLIESKLFYKAIRKEKKKIARLLSVIEDSTVDYMLESIREGVNIISFADPAGTIDIVGPKTYNEVAGKSIYNILKRVENELGNTIIHLCGKTSTSLEVAGFLKSEKIKTNGKDYFEMIRNVKKERKDIKFIGHWCLQLDKCNNEIINCKIN